MLRLLMPYLGYGHMIEFHSSNIFIASNCMFQNVAIIIFLEEITVA
jgi:hypothetical protein